MLPLANYQLLATTDNGMEALRFIHRFEPDLVLMGWNLRGLSSSEVMQNLILQHLCPIVVVLTQEEHYVLPEVVEGDAHHVLVYPTRVLEMVAGIHMAEHRFQRESEHLKQVQRLEDELKTRKIIFQAMLTLIHQLGISEQEAYKHLRSHSMESRKSLRYVAQEVIKGIWLPPAPGEALADAEQ